MIFLKGNFEETDIHFKRSIQNSPVASVKQGSVEPRVSNASVVFVDGEARFVRVNDKDGKIHL